MMGTVAAAFIGTIAFSVLFGVPKKYIVCCGITGAAGWLVYCLLTGNSIPDNEATFFAACVVVLLSRGLAVLEKCPATIFLTTGIFPLVPGGGIYWTVYYFVTGNLETASQAGFRSLGLAFSIVLGIVAVFEIPDRLFSCWRK